MDDVEVVVAHRSRATLRVGEVFVKIDPDDAALDREVEAMALAPVPTPRVLWRQPPVLALAAVAGRPVARLGEPATAPAAAWRAVGAAVRALHDAPLPPWPSRRGADRGAALDAECAWLIEHDVVPREVVEPNRDLALLALREREPAFVHGDLHVAHVLVDDAVVTGVLDWSEAGVGDPAADLASLTLGHREQLDDVVTGYGDGVDVDAVRGHWALRALTATRWLLEHGFDPTAPGCEVDLLRALA